jgi:hypothetical protein
VRRKGIKARGEGEKSCRTRKAKVLPVHERKVSKEVVVELHSVLNLGTRSSCSNTCSGCISSGENPRTHLIDGRLYPRSGLYGLEKIKIRDSNHGLSNP